MKTITLIISLFISLMAYSQVSYRQVPETKTTIPVYDSLSNIPAESIKSFYGHDALILDNYHFYDTANVNGTKVTNIIKSIYTVVEVFRDGPLWIHMQNKTGDVYYGLNENSLDNPSFIMLEYYEKQKQLKLNKNFKLRSAEEFKELNTGTVKSFGADQEFTCTDITILEEGKQLIPSYILSTSTGEEIGVPLKGFNINSSRSVNQFDIQ